MTAPAHSTEQATTAPRTLALWLIAFLVAATVPYVWLIAHFGYDDILREPTAVILANFHAGGASLVLAWFGFAMSSLLFIPVALGFNRLLAAHGVHDPSASVLGIASAIAQAIGLLRWVLVVPALAATFMDPQSSAATRDATRVVFDAVHRYGGMVLGEMVGQLLLAGWTALVARQLWRTRAVPRWLAAAGAATLPFWLIGQTELLHQVMPAIPSIEATPLAFMAWEAWLAALACTLLAGAWRQRLTSPAPRR
ncbi:MAG: hypothetical protein RLZZ373_3767 [Pseudomonadota bacterium]|jgi:hypothetical protein